MNEALITYVFNDFDNPKSILCYYECETEIWDAEDDLIANGEAICIVKTEIIKRKGEENA